MDAILELGSAALSAGPLIAGLTAVGAMYVALKLDNAVSATYKMFFRPGKDLKKLGEWCVITGATDGIGKAYALTLAKKGINVVLVSRTESKLKDVAKEIADSGCQVQTKCVVCDYSNFDKKAQDTVKAAIKDLDVGILINNVGISYRYPVFFHELDDERVAQLIEMNINSTVWMTRMVLPGMVKRKRGAIVNLSSGSAMYDMPLLAEYSGAKSFLEKFSRGLNAEYSAQGITCQCQIPFYVATKLAKMRKSLMVPTPMQYAKAACKWIGHADAVASPILPHALQGFVLDHLPGWLIRLIVMYQHLGIRKRGLKKDAKLAAEAGNKKSE